MRSKSARSNPLSATALPLIRLVLVVLSVLTLGPIAAVRAQSASDGFNPNANGTVRTLVVQPDGKIIIGGDFNMVGGQTRNRLARINPDGSLDLTFNPNASGQIYALALLPEGKILVGGAFTLMGGQTRNRLARLNPDGSPDADFNPGADNTVFALTRQPDGKILVGGAFTNLGGYSRSRLARLNPDGSVDTAFNPNVNGNVLTLLSQPDGRIVVGGEFGQVGGQVRNRLARLNPDGSLDAYFNPNASGGVMALALQPDGKILVGGNFTLLGGQTRNRLARLHADGSLDLDFTLGADNVVYALALQPDGRIMVGGAFALLGGQTRNRIARLTPDAALDTAFPLTGTTNNSVLALGLQLDGKILVGGQFSVIGGQARNYIARLEPEGFLETTFNPAPNGSVYALAFQPDGKILVGGNFTTLGGQSRERIARLNPDGSVDLTFNPGANALVYALAVQPDGKILVGGNFTALDGQPTMRLGRLNPDGSRDDAFALDADGTVNALLIQPDGKILIGGAFTTLGGTDRQRLARIDSDGLLDPDFTPAPDNVVNTLALQPDGKILAGGIFTTVNGIDHNYLVRLASDGTPEAGFNPDPDGGIYSLALQPDGRIWVGGLFSMIGGEPHNYLARLASDGTPESAFTLDADSLVYSLIVQANGQILVGGNFTHLGGQLRNYLGRINADGSLDTAFDPGASGQVYSLALQPDGKPVVGGAFATLGGQSRSSLGRLSNAEAVRQEITTTTTGDIFTWIRKGPTPELDPGAFEWSTDAASYISLGTGTRTADGWQITGIPTLPLRQTLFIRARGQHRGAIYAGSGSLVESVRAIFLRDTSTVTLTSSANPATFGQLITFTAVVTAPTGLPNGYLTFYVDGQPFIRNLNPAGVAIYTTTLSADIHPVSAVYGGDAEHFGSSAPELSQIVERAATTTALGSAPNPSAFGQTVDFTATVTSTAGIPSGNVRFTVDGAPFMAPLDAKGVATYTTDQLTGGNHSVIASYLGSINYIPSTSTPRTQTVNRVGTTTAFNLTPAAAVFGQSVTFTATVTTTLPPTLTAPTGVVTFTAGNTVLVRPVDAEGIATGSTTAIAAGTYTVTAEYGGDNNYLPSAATGQPLAVDPAATATALTIAPPDSVFGQAVTLTAAVSALAPGGGIPTGTVTFTVGGTPIVRPLGAGGVATHILSGLDPATYPIRAAYAGTPNFNSSQSSEESHTVARADTTTALTSSADPALLGETVTFTATVAPVPPGAGMPTGWVTFTLAGTPISRPLDSAGRAVWATTALTAGRQQLAAHYSGDLDFNPSEAAPLTQTVQISTSTALEAAPDPARFGETVTFTATVAAGFGTPTGTVTFTLDGIAVIRPLDSNGIALYTTGTLTPGMHTVRAEYPGQGDYRPSASPVRELSVEDIPPADLTVLSSSPTRLGETTFFTATAAGSNLYYTWNFGDDTPPTAASSPLTHTYAQSGNYMVIVTATNSAGVLTGTLQVTVTPPGYYTYIPLVLRETAGP